MALTTARMFSREIQESWILQRHRSASEEETNETYKMHECTDSRGIRSRSLSVYWLRWRINGRVTQRYFVSDQFDLR